MLNIMPAIALPAINAMLNATSAFFIISGFIFIKQRRINAHRASMVAALTSSTIFLISYLYYHATHGSTRFSGEGLIRPVYFTILLTHTVLAALVVPFVLAAVYRAARGQFSQHARIARWTFPIWLYVSVTGVIVYLMLYQFYPAH
jgi:uncharacterized membrane protein YozB (DUF420 family)